MNEMTGVRARPDWVKFEPARWMSGTAEMDAITEFVFFRLCLIAYEKADPVVSGSAKRNAMRCKVDLETYQDAVEILVEFEKITLVEDGVLIHSTVDRLNDSVSRITARQRGAAISRRRRELKFEGRKPAQIDQIISKEFPDNQSGDQSGDQSVNKTDRHTDKTDRQDTQGGVGEQLELVSPEQPAEDQFSQAVSIWSEMAVNEGLSVVQSMSDTRRKKLMERLKEVGGIEGWDIACRNVAESDFLCGRVKGKDWRATFDFMLQPNSLAKIMERSYPPYRNEKINGASPVVQAMRNI